MLGGRINKRLIGSARVRDSARRPRRKFYLLGGAVVVLAAATVLAVTLWPDPPIDPRARVYTEATACLLTGDHGVTDPAAAPVWAGMQQASQATRGKVQYLEVDGPQTGENAASYLTTLVSGQCDLVLTVGKAPGAAVPAVAAAHPQTRFLLVGSGVPGSNVTVLSETDPARVTSSVQAAVADVLRSSTSD